MSDTTGERLLEALLFVIGALADGYIIDCTNGMCLRDKDGAMIHGGPNLIARYLCEHPPPGVARLRVDAGGKP